MPLWSPPDSPEECALQMIGRYEISDTAIQQAHAYDLDAYTDEERAYWRAVLKELRAYSCNDCNDAGRFLSSSAGA